MLKYPQAFVDKCKKIYPHWEDLNQNLHSNSKTVGRLLESAVGFSLDEDQIISLFRNKKEHKILEAAKRAQEKREIYQEWIAIVDSFADKQAERNGYSL